MKQITTLFLLLAIALAWATAAETIAGHPVALDSEGNGATNWVVIMR